MGVFIQNYLKPQKSIVTLLSTLCSIFVLFKSKLLTTQLNSQPESALCLTFKTMIFNIVFYQVVLNSLNGVSIFFISCKTSAGISGRTSADVLA